MELTAETASDLKSEGQPGAEYLADIRLTYRAGHREGLQRTAEIIEHKASYKRLQSSTSRKRWTSRTHRQWTVSQDVALIVFRSNCLGIPKNQIRAAVADALEIPWRYSLAA